MHTRRHVLASIPALVVMPPAQAGEPAADENHHVEAILKIKGLLDGAAWSAHQEPDFILIKRDS